MTQVGTTDIVGRLRLEVELTKAQTVKSRQARGVFSSRDGGREASPQLATLSPRSAVRARENNFSPSPEAPDAVSSLHNPVAVVAVDTNSRKEGFLMHLTKSGSFGIESFQRHYIVVEESSGVSWYNSKDAYMYAPQRPLGNVPFWRESTNSRGSRFKKAAVCWPLILPEDCRQATDPTLQYFAIDYAQQNDSHAKEVLATPSTAERDEWIRFISKYIEVYLAPRAESEDFQHLTQRASIPVHRSCVIDGEAPGGNVL